MITINKDDLILFLDFLLDKVEDCYYDECKKAIDNFIERNIRGVLNGK